MNSKSMTFRFPLQIVQAIEFQARATGRDRTTVVTEALSQSFGLSLPETDSVTVEILHQRIKQVEANLALIAGQIVGEENASSKNAASTVNDTRYCLDLLKQIDGSLRAILSNPLAEDILAEDILAEDPLRESRADLASPPRSEIVRYGLQPRYPSPAVGRSHLQLAAYLMPQADLLEQVIATAPESVFVCDRQLQILYINPSGRQTIGLEQRPTAALTLQSFNLSPDLKSQLAAQVETVFVSKWPITSEFQLGTPLFGQQHYEYTLSPISLTANDISSKQENDAVLFRAKRITEYKQLEAALKELDSRFHHLFESTDDSILILDTLTHQILDANRNMSRRLGYTHQDLLKLNIEDIAPLWMRTIGVDLFQQLRSHGKTVFSHYLRHKDSTRISVEVHSYLVEYGDRLIIQSAIRDVETSHSLMPELP